MQSNNHKGGASPSTNNSGGSQEYIPLEKHLVLLAWLNSLLGYEKNSEMLKDTQTAAEGFADGHSYLYHHLYARGSKLKISPEALKRYDDNIRTHLATINRHRPKPITLRYFQYMAALYTEIILDRLFGDKDQLLADLNKFVKEWNAQQRTENLQVEPSKFEVEKEDLSKLAFWMATGSGKTLLLHLNYYQFQHYNKQSLDNILLITPNEGLSEQHLAELRASGIPARRFGGDTRDLWTSGPETIQVIEITKLVEDKRSGGVRIPVEAFEGRNLIFVDEGHKGSGGKAWRKYRDALGKIGFTFEYSATFGQALSAARDDRLIAEYGKCIVFDYSYRYFYGDGYGKDFRILNLKKETNEDQTDLLLLANLLSFYEQLHIYDKEKTDLVPYNLEKPLWIFIGSTVNAVYDKTKGKGNRGGMVGSANTQENDKRSDVLTVVRFLHRFLRNEQNWAVNGIKELLEGRWVSSEGKDIFAAYWPYLRSMEPSPSELYECILETVFHAKGGGSLHVCEIKGSAGELGLKASEVSPYFGVIYIGDAGAFKKLLEETNLGITMKEDILSASLFGDINRPDSHIHILIGARKFMEGWNSWRVSSMGLLNIGEQEGPLIIQLFGRGVRLKGKDMSLKRSSALPGNHPQNLRLLETLNIFAVRANYMAQFREYLEREGVETEAPIELRLPVKINDSFLERGLVIPRPKEGCDFVAEKTLMLEVDKNIEVQVDMTPRLQVIESGEGSTREANKRADKGQTIPSERLMWVDWEKVYLDLLAHKARRGLRNLLILPEMPEKIFPNINYTLIADEEVVSPSFAKRELLQEAVTNILCKYVDAFYRKKREEWETNEALIYQDLKKEDPNLSFNQDKGSACYIIRVRRSESDLVEKLQKLIDAIEKLRQLKGMYTQEEFQKPINEAEEWLYKQEDKKDTGLSRIYFESHLYLPLLVEEGDKLHIIPAGIKPSEKKFVHDLKEYWESEKDKLLAGKEVFLLRNLSRGKGVGFFEESGFYPDFILWIVDESGQRIVFIEPHGMLHAKAYIHDEKARLHERLDELSKKIAERSKQQGIGQDIRLDSYIISATPLKELQKRYDDGSWDEEKFAEHHILFQDDKDYIAKLLQRVLNKTSS